METRIKKTETTTLYKYLNKWAEADKHPEAVKEGKLTEYGKGYQDACKDIFNKLFNGQINISTNLLNIKIESEEDNGKHKSK